jgi:hypothetical protein
MMKGLSVAAFIAANKRVVFRGAIATFVGGEHLIELEPSSAQALLAGQAAYIPKRHSALGVLGGSPVVVDMAQPEMAVKVLANGKLVAVTRSFAAFLRGCEPEKPA